MIGVNVNSHEPKSLKKVMTKENINWRSFADQGAIVRKWNSPATPAFYVIDHTGAIRNKWVGGADEKAIDAALEKLIDEAEKANTPR